VWTCKALVYLAAFTTAQTWVAYGPVEHTQLSCTIYQHAACIRHKWMIAAILLAKCHRAAPAKRAKRYRSVPPHAKNAAGQCACAQVLDAPGHTWSGVGGSKHSCRQVKVSAQAAA